MTKSLLRHDTKQSREAALEEVSPSLSTFRSGMSTEMVRMLRAITRAVAMGKALSLMVDRRVRVHHVVCERNLSTHQWQIKHTAFVA